MGLTIHYDLRFPGGVADRARAKLEALRQKCLDLPFQEVDDKLFEAKGDEADFSRADDDDPKRWLLIQAQVSRKIDRHTYKRISPAHVIGFSTWPGKGCEEANFGLALYLRGRSFGCAQGKSWSWHSFCKTQYANDPDAGGLSNFLRCHLTVVAALDAAKALEFRVRVSDEGGFWENRSVEKLSREIGEWDQLIAGIGGILKDALGENIVSAMDGRKDFERLEHEAESNPGFLKVRDKVWEMAELIRCAEMGCFPSLACPRMGDSEGIQPSGLLRTGTGPERPHQDGTVRRLTARERAKTPFPLKKEYEL